MPLQNRVDPFGTIHAVPERGSLMGNRGIIHDPHTRTLLKKRWALKAWIICVCDFRGVRRVPMGSNRVVDGERRAGWTELFFLDEVTALAALPDGAMISSKGKAYALREGTALPWGFRGYGQPVDPKGLADALSITPATTLAVLRAGYRPAWA
ncbi:MAG: hypothetical protein J0J15_14095, partial [Mesorhizobium sp.]|nr:hypothetical protein [Mesorhizobium sp.]